MMLPAAIASPPNIFTPSLWPGESRPLREEPPAFLCAMYAILARTGGDAGDLHLGEVGAGAALAVGVLAPLLLEGDDLRAAAVLDDLGFDAGAGNQRGAGFGAVAAQHQDLGERDLGAHLAFELGDREHVVLGNPILLSAAADDGKHGQIPEKCWSRAVSASGAAQYTDGTPRVKAVGPHLEPKSADVIKVVEPIGPAEILDLRGLKCPLPALLARRALLRAEMVSSLSCSPTTPLPPVDVPHMCHREGFEVLSIGKTEKGSEMVLRRGPRTAAHDKWPI